MHLENYATIIIIVYLQYWDIGIEATLQLLPQKWGVVL